nr:immunoglobulin light chain junction region [Macaca mulatta]MOW06375.1 immunoglobulin light chain junction region [Macaca mulatta]
DYYCWLHYGGYWVF